MGLRFTALADEIRFPQSLSPEAVAEVLRLRGRMERERVPRGVDRTLHLKLGPGGLTDVEWAAQLLQLRYGVDGREPAHDARRFRCWPRPQPPGLLSAAEEQALRAAWIGVVHARNAVVLTTGRESDVLPAERAAAHGRRQRPRLRRGRRGAAGRTPRPRTACP